MQRSRRRRRALCLTLLALWATQLLPLLHQIGHQLDHVHGPLGQLHYFPLEEEATAPVEPREHWHQHASGGAHEHASHSGDDRRPTHGDSEQSESAAYSRGGVHGAGSPLHFQATWTPPAPLPEPVWIAAQSIFYLTPRLETSRWMALSIRTARVRGPPTKEDLPIG